MNPKQKKTQGFTLIELLVVITIMGILTSMIGASVVMASKKAYLTRARAEVRELVSAWRAYYVLYGKYPYTDDDVPMTAEKIAPLLGYSEDENPRRKTFLEFPDDEDYLDPWNNPYRVNFDLKSDDEADIETYTTAITFPMRTRGVFPEEPEEPETP